MGIIASIPILIINLHSCTFCRIDSQSELLHAFLKIPICLGAGTHKRVPALSSKDSCNIQQQSEFSQGFLPLFENLVLAYKWLYLSLMEIFPDADNLGDFSPELLDLEKRLTPDEKTSAFKQINDFLNRRRPYVFEK